MIEQEPLLRVLVVSVCAYAALILIIRLTGKRSLAKLNAFDLVITVALGSMLATIILSKETSLAEGIFALLMLAALQYAASKLSLLTPLFRMAVRSSPSLLVSHGVFLDQAMKEERLTQGEVESAIRKQGIGRIEDVAAAVLETDGSISVIEESEGGPLSLLGSVQRVE